MQTDNLHAKHSSSIPISGVKGAQFLRKSWQQFTQFRYLLTSSHPWKCQYEENLKHRRRQCCEARMKLHGSDERKLYCLFLRWNVHTHIHSDTLTVSYRLMAVKVYLFCCFLVPLRGILSQQAQQWGGRRATGARHKIYCFEISTLCLILRSVTGWITRESRKRLPREKMRAALKSSCCGGWACFTPPWRRLNLVKFNPEP